MMEYKRLTKKGGLDFADKNLSLVDEWGYSHIYNRLAELEDAIEQGKMKELPEDSVVLTGMETEQQFEDLMVAFDEMGFMPNTTHPFPEEYVETWKQRLIFVFGQLRKETAEKFARLVEFHSVSTRDENGREMFTISALGLKEILHEEFGIPYDEICSNITEGRDE